MEINNIEYSNKEYWNERFLKTEGFFDWYVGWKELKDIFSNIINFNSNILIVGCGNSKLSENMYNDNFQNITNIDISEIVIEKMNNIKKIKQMDNMKYLEMDATRMNFENNYFDFVIDKGTLDALTCSKDFEISTKLIQEMHRVTKINGFYSIISHSSPEIRLPLYFECLQFGTYELSCQKVELSLMSNLINSIKSHKKEKNISMKECINNKEILMESLIEVLNDHSKQIKNKEELKNNKFYKLANALQFLKMKNMKKTIENNECAKIEGNKDLNNNNLKNTESIRRNHCYCYVFFKIK